MAEPQKWEYACPLLSHAGERWGGKRPDGIPGAGLSTTLDTWGAEGWELVSLVPTFSPGAPTYSRYECTQLLACFKRPMP